MRSRYLFTLTAVVLMLGVWGCAKEEAPVSATGVRRAPADIGANGVILLSQAQFLSEPGKGPVPGPARLEFIRAKGGKWTREVLEDSMSNVFHKAKIMEMHEKSGVLTIGGNNAALTFWTGERLPLIPTRLWEPVFGGTHNRCRDIEVGDVDGDGNKELVIATHDQGVVAVLDEVDGAWEVTRVDSSPKTFVHEVEIGDLDGDGKLEFYVTPSQPNRASGKSQPGMVIQFMWNGSGYQRAVVDSFADTHAKEILVTDIDGDGKDELYVVKEAVVERTGGETSTKAPVTIAEYTWDGSAWGSKKITTIPDRQCRFLLPTDLDNDGKRELVAAGFRSGLWWLKPNPGGAWSRTQIDKDSSGYEHACAAGDMNNDGIQELYVAADDQKELRRYIYVDGDTFTRETILPLVGDVITWGLTLGRL